MQKDIERDRQTDKQTDRQTDRQTDSPSQYIHASLCGCAQIRLTFTFKSERVVS